MTIVRWRIWRRIRCAGTQPPIRIQRFWTVSIPDEVGKGEATSAMPRSKREYLPSALGSFAALG